MVCTPAAPLSCSTLGTFISHSIQRVHFKIRCFRECWPGGVAFANTFPASQVCPFPGLKMKLLPGALDHFWPTDHHPPQRHSSRRSCWKSTSLGRMAQLHLSGIWERRRKRPVVRLLAGFGGSNTGFLAETSDEFAAVVEPDGGVTRPSGFEQSLLDGRGPVEHD
jgi:hypothetical protein